MSSENVNPSGVLSSHEVGSSHHGEEKDIEKKKKARPAPKKEMFRRTSHPLDSVFKKAATFRSLSWDEDVLQAFSTSIGLGEHAALKAATVDDRPYDDTQGAVVFWKHAKCGFRLPLSDFSRQVLVHLDIPPGQLHPMAWCVVTSFERFIIGYSQALGLPAITPSLRLFGHYFVFFQTSDFCSVRAKANVPLFGNKPLKVDYWEDRFCFIQEPHLGIHQIAPKWNRDTESFNKVTLDLPNMEEYAFVHQLHALMQARGNIRMAFTGVSEKDEVMSLIDPRSAVDPPAPRPKRKTNLTITGERRKKKVLKVQVERVASATEKSGDSERHGENPQVSLLEGASAGEGSGSHTEPVDNEIASAKIVETDSQEERGKSPLASDEEEDLFEMNTRVSKQPLPPSRFAEAEVLRLTSAPHQAVPLLAETEHDIPDTPARGQFLYSDDDVISHVPFASSSRPSEPSQVDIAPPPPQVDIASGSSSSRLPPLLNELHELFLAKDARIAQLEFQLAEERAKYKRLEENSDQKYKDWDAVMSEVLAVNKEIVAVNEAVTRLNLEQSEKLEDFDRLRHVLLLKLDSAMRQRNLAISQLTGLRSAHANEVSRREKSEANEQMLLGEVDKLSALVTSLTAEKATASKSHPVDEKEKDKIEREYLSAFLNSRAFHRAAGMKTAPHLRKALMKAALVLRHYYPFSNREFGLIDSEEISDLPDVALCSWDRSRDKLLDPAGKVLKGKIEIKDVATAPAYPWPEDVVPWPSDVEKPELPDSE